MTTISVNWDLASIFKGGSQSATLNIFLNKLANDLEDFDPKLPDLQQENAQPIWVETIQTLYNLGARLKEANAFIGCLVSQDIKDDYALQLMGRIDLLRAKLDTLWTQLEAIFLEQEDEDWNRLLEETVLKEVAFHLNEQRDLACRKMDSALETLASELSTDGYHAWGRFYNVISNDYEVIFEGQLVSLGQLQNKYMDDPDRSVRRAAFELFQESWAKLAKSCAMALNYQAGFRLTVYKHRGWDSVLQEPLLKNRLTAETLEVMWHVVDQKSDKLLDYFKAKSKLLGLEGLCWYDLAAPVGEIPQNFTYKTASEFVIENLHRFNPDIAEYSQMAVHEHWIEAEDRTGKRAGAYCTSFPLSRQSRIFMTYNGSPNGILTLAHELGHGYHGWVMRDLPYGARHYTMSLAETASTFNEMIVTNARLKMLTDDQERLSLLGTKLNDVSIFLMNIRARFDFELAFFKQRTKKQLSADELSDLMLEAEKIAYKDGLAEYHPHLWASKLHFYLTQAPFYNFPYTFGFLFGSGLYARALEEGSAFRDSYVALLRDTGSMKTEELAQIHLGVDLTQPEFWEMALDRVLADVDEFVALVDKLI